MAFLNSKNTGYLVKKPMTWGFLAQIWTKKLTKNKYVTSPTPQNPIHTYPPSLHPFSFLSLFSSPHTFSPLLPHVFLFTPTPKIHPFPILIPSNLPNHPNSPHSNHPIPTSQISLPQTLPWLRPKSIPHPSSNNPKTVNTILHPPYTTQNNR